MTDDAKGATAPGFSFQDIPEDIRDPELWRRASLVMFRSALTCDGIGYYDSAEERRKLARFFDLTSRKLRESSDD